MLDQRYVSDQLEIVKERLGLRGVAPSELDRVRKLAGERKKVIQELESLRAKHNEVSKAMGKVADKKSEEFAARREEMRASNERIKALEELEKRVVTELDDALLTLPNLPHESVPQGKSADDNRVVRVGGEKPSFDFPIKDHLDVGTGLGILDFDRATKISGARFALLRGLGARLERAIMSFMLDVHTNEHGYTEIWPPAIVKDSALRGTSQLPKFASDLFRLARDESWVKQQEGQYELFLSPTSEVQLTNLHADEILEAAAMPVAYTAYTPCFRSEAGSYGKDTRGLIRNHQFDKVELVRFVRPDAGLAELETLTSHAESILERLGLHFRRVELCMGDLGFASQKTYDLEVWLPAQDAYREISSCSWFGDFQARRAKIRFRPEPGGKPQLLHTLNGSGLAIGRTLVAILENFQQKDGSVRVPAALRPYMGGREVIA
jgi:seryl-tRNA synthetase